MDCLNIESNVSTSNYSSESVKEKLTKYLKDNNLHELPESLFDVDLREYPEGYEILDFMPEENFGSKGFYRYLMLKVKDIKTGAIFNYPMQINDNSKERFGVLYIAKIGNKFAFVNEFRMGEGDFVLNFPRGFPEKIDNVLREFLEEVSEDFDWSKMTLNKLTDSLEGSSSSFNKCEFYLLEYDGDESTMKFGGQEGNRIVLLSEEEIDNKILEGKIHCNFTLAAWGYYKAMTARNKKKVSILSKIQSLIGLACKNI